MHISNRLIGGFAIAFLTMYAPFNQAATIIGRDLENGLSVVIVLVSGKLSEGNEVELEISLKNERADIGIVLQEPILVPRLLRDDYEEPSDWRSAYATPKLHTTESAQPWYYCRGGFSDGGALTHGKKDVESIFLESSKRVFRERGKEDENLFFLAPQKELKNTVKLKLDKGIKGVDFGVFCMAGWFPPETPELIKRTADQTKYRLWTGALYCEVLVPEISK